MNSCCIGTICASQNYCKDQHEDCSWIHFECLLWKLLLYFQLIWYQSKNAPFIAVNQESAPLKSGAMSSRVFIKQKLNGKSLKSSVWRSSRWLILYLIDVSSVSFKILRQHIWSICLQSIWYGLKIGTSDHFSWTKAWPEVNLSRLYLSTHEVLWCTTVETT